MASIRVQLAAATVAVSLGGIPGLAASQQDAPAAAPTCLAVMLPSVQGVEGSASEMAAAVRDLFVSFLNGPAIQPTSLEARLPSQAVLEARQKGCGQVLNHVFVPQAQAPRWQQVRRHIRQGGRNRRMAHAVRRRR